MGISSIFFIFGIRLKPLISGNIASRIIMSGLSFITNSNASKAFSAVIGM